MPVIPKKGGSWSLFCYEFIPNELRTMEACSKRMEPYKRALLHRAADAIEGLQKTVEQMKSIVIVEAQHTEMFDERDKKTLMEMVKSLPLRIIPYRDEKPRWIPVTERLPEKGKYVLVRYKNNDMTVACWFDGDEDILFWRAMTDEGWCADCDTDPTHWMPLPASPKEEA